MAKTIKKIKKSETDRTVIKIPTVKILMEAEDDPRSVEDWVALLLDEFSAPTECDVEFGVSRLFDVAEVLYEESARRRKRTKTQIKKRPNVQKSK